MASTFDLLALSSLARNFGNLATLGAGGSSLYNLLRSGSPGTTPQAVDQFIAQSQAGLTGLQDELGRFRSPEAIARRTSGAQSEIGQKRALAQSGLGVQGSFDAAKLGATNRFNEAQRLIP